MLMKIISYLLGAAICVIALFLIVAVLPIPGNVKLKIVQSGSMEPAILTGSVVIIKPSPVYEVGEVITFGADTKTQVPTTHRVVSIQGEGAQTQYQVKGDSNEEADPELVKGREVIGKVLFAVPYAGYLLDFAKKPLGFALLVGVPAVLVILGELGKIWGEVRKIQRSKKREEDPPVTTYGISQNEN